MAIGSVNYGGGNAFPYGPPKGTIATTGEALNKLLTAIQQRKKDQYDKTLLYQLSETLGMTTNSQQNKKINDIAGNVNPGSVSGVTAEDWNNLDFNQLMGKMWNMINQDQTKDFIPDVMEQRLQGKGSYRGPTTQLETTLLNLALQEVQGQPSPAEKMKEMAGIFANMKNAMTSERHAKVAEGTLALQGEQFKYNQGMDQKKFALEEDKFALAKEEFSKNADLIDAQIANYTKKEQWEVANETALKALEKGVINDREYLSIINRYDMTDKTGDLARQKEALLNSFEKRMGREATEEEKRAIFGIASGGDPGFGKNIFVDPSTNIAYNISDGSKEVTANAQGITGNINKIVDDIVYDMADATDMVNKVQSELNKDEYYEHPALPNNALYPGMKAEDIVYQALDERMTNSKVGLMPMMEDLQMSDTGRLKAKVQIPDGKGKVVEKPGMEMYEDLYPKYDQTLKDMAELGKPQFKWYLSPKDVVTSSGFFGWGKSTRVTANPMERLFVMELENLAADKNSNVSNRAEAWNSLTNEELEQHARALSEEFKKSGLNFDFNVELISKILKQNTDIAVESRNINIEPYPKAGRIWYTTGEEAKTSLFRYR